MYHNYACNLSSFAYNSASNFRTNRGHNGLLIKTIDRSSPMTRNIETIDSSLSQDPACASLLPKTEADERYNNNLFGQFKGFTITPIPNQSKLVEPTKPAPSPPTIPTVAIKTNVKPIQKCSAPRTNLLNSGFNDNATTPMLPPLNPGSTARPLISSPVLAATTCTSVELIASKVPTRPAPDVPTRPAPAPPITGPISAPTKPQRPNSTPLTNVILPTSEFAEKKPEKGSTLNRIASMLRPSSGIMRSNSQSSQKDDKNTNSLPRSHHHKANKVIDKEILRNLEISHPIPQKDIEITTPVIPVIPAAETEKRHVVLRAQSMRDSKITPRPAVHTFGSMRQTTPTKRPTSIPASTRPTSPPPGPPCTAQTEKAAENSIKIPGLPGYQNPPVKSLTQSKPIEDTYDDCMNLIAEPSLTRIMEESPSNDNIYAVIEESVPEKNRKNVELLETPSGVNEYKTPKRVDTTPNTNNLESMGLLSEIVSEISNRNFDSIYSTSTLTRKKKEIGREEEVSKSSENMGSDSSLGGYMNSNHYKTPGSVYSNSTSGKFNSSSSTTSSGYLHPSVINVPQMDRKEPNKSVSDANDNSKPVDKSKSNTLKSNNPNINDEISKELGMKPPENLARYKPFATTKTRPIPLVHIKKDDQAESKAPAKPPLNRTKTPPNIAKSPTSKETPESNVKLTRQSSDNTLKHSGRQGSDSGLLPSKFSKASDACSTTAKQSANASPTARQTQMNTSKSSSDLGKDESHTTVSVKNVPCSPKDSLGKFNSPDLVSSCSNSNQCGTKSPDVVGSNPKLSLALKTVQKISTLPKNTKTPTTPLKPLAITSKSTSLSEKKKSPIGNVGVAKLLSPSVKDVADGNKLAPHLTSKVSAKTETRNSDNSATRTNPLQRAASGKSNVASLQQKFEANRNPGVVRTISNTNKKSAIARAAETNGSGARK